VRGDARDREFRRRREVAGGLRLIAAVADDASSLRMRECSKDIVEPIVGKIFRRNVQPWINVTRLPAGSATCAFVTQPLFVAGSTTVPPFAAAASSAASRCGTTMPMVNAASSDSTSAPFVDAPSEHVPVKGAQRFDIGSLDIEVADAVGNEGRSRPWCHRSLLTIR
jgi:hypothetical protein